MATIRDNPWASGPAEILKHAMSLLETDSDTNRRLAMILTDNAIEQTIKAFLNLPKRITGISISRKRLQEISESFPALLDALEEHASDKLEGIDLGVIEWYHRLRNELYHQGFGLTVERDKVEIYMEHGQILFKNLFGISLFEKEEDKTPLLGRFIELWGRLEVSLTSTLETVTLPSQKHRPIIDIARSLRDGGIITEKEYATIIDLRIVRNLVVHGQQNHQQALTEELVAKLEEIVISLEKIES